MLSAQDCDGLRYQDEIFSTVDRQTFQYATADPYGIIPSQDLFLDIYTPVGDTLQKRPVILFAFGGAFLIGDRRQPIIPEYCEYYAKRGYVMVSIDYRIGFNTLSADSAERAVYRAVQDIRAAQRFLAEFDDDYGIDINNMFLTGTSAGCIASIHTAYMTESERPASTYGVFLEPTDLGCGDCSGNNYYGNQEVPVRGIINHWGAIGDLSWIDNSPTDRKPIISFHGTSDFVVPYDCGRPFSLPIWPETCGSGEMHPQFDLMGIPNQLVPFYGAAHEPELTDGTYTDTMFMFTTPFLFDIIKPQTSVISGSIDVCANDQITYQVDPTVGSSYCWDIQGGSIVSDNGHSIDVLWDGDLPFSIQVQEKNCIDASGPIQALAINLINPPTSNMLINQINDSTVEVQDLSENATEYTVDFGDGSAPVVVMAGQNYTYTYTTSGTYTITQSVNNICGSDLMTSTVTIVVSSIFNPIDFDEIVLFPNPLGSTKRINFQLENTVHAIEVLGIKDVLGKTLPFTPVNNPTFIDLHHLDLKAGIYFIHVKQSTKEGYLKLLVN